MDSLSRLDADRRAFGMMITKSSAQAIPNIRIKRRPAHENKNSDTFIGKISKPRAITLENKSEVIYIVTDELWRLLIQYRINSSEPKP
jgi:hypothetical protein